MSARLILFISLTLELEQVLDESFRASYEPLCITPGHLPDLTGIEETAQLVVVSGYSLQEIYRELPELEVRFSGALARLPRLYLLQETDPSLSLVPLKGEQRFFYLRGPLSLRALRSAVDRILAMKPRPMRFPLSPDLGISVRFSIRRRRCPPIWFQKDIEEISPTGFSFYWDPDDSLIYPGDQLEDVELRAHERVFLSTIAQVKHLTPLRKDDRIHGLRVGIEFVHTALEGEQSDSRSNAFLDDPLVIRTVLADAVERQTDVLVRGESQSWELNGVMLSCDVEKQQLQVRLEPPGVPRELQDLDIVSCQFVRDNAQLQFSSVLLEVAPEENTLFFRFPKRLDKLWARSTLRYNYDHETAPQVEVFTPITPDQPLIRTVMNLSPNGLCFWADAQRDLLFRGMHLDRLELRLNNGQQVTLKGEIRYLGPRDLEVPPDRIPCGIQFREVSALDHHRLVTYLISKNFPRVSDATPEDEEPLWTFLERGDFYTPAKRQECLGEPEEVRETHARMLNADAGFSRKLVFRDSGVIYGTVALQQIYQHTWLVHHLCAMRHRSDFVPRHLLLFLGEYISKTPEIDYIKMMWRPNNTWSNKIFGRLVHRLHDGEQSVVKVYSYLHRREAPLPPPHPEEAAWHIRPISGDEVIELESHFIQQEEFFLMKSEDLFRGDLGLERLDARYKSLGLFRERKVFVAFDGGRLAGFTLVERASPGLNLSNLLNAFQVHIAIGDPERVPALKRALIRRAIQYYASHGQRRSIALTEESDLSAYQAMGFEKVKEYISWTFDHNIANIYNLYCYYIFRLYERIEAQRSARRVQV